MYNAFNHTITLLKRIILLLILFSLTRLLFYIFNFSTFKPGQLKEIVNSFFFGIRFDFVVIYYINIIFILFHFIPGNFKNHKNYQLILKYLYIVTGAVLLLANFIDIEYFKFTNKRSGIEMISMLLVSSETSKMVLQYIRGYWLLTVLWLLCVYILIKFYPKLKEYNLKLKYHFVNKYITVPLLSIVLLIAGFACARGLKTKPIRIITANEYVKSKYAPILLNTPFTILNTFTHNNFTIKRYFDDKYALGLFNPVKNYNKDKLFKNSNVIIIILESFSKEYIEGFKRTGKSYTPFLDSLMQHSLVCKNAYANACRSIDALPSIVASMPSLMDESLIGSIYSVNKINSLSSLLKQKGYHTSFFHGGKNGTMGFNDFCRAAEIDNYYGEYEYPDKSAYDGSWGIYDEEFFQFFAQKLNTFKRPFFSVFFSLSSHPPYAIPAKYKDKFPKGEIKILESVAYTDYSLRQFFSAVSSMPWYNNTLFVICADHTSVSYFDDYKTSLGRLSIPIIYFHPTDISFKGKCLLPTQQIDIMPTIFDYLNYPDKFIAFGESIYNHSNHFCCIFNNGIYQIIDSSYCLQFNGEKPIALYNYKNDILLTKNIIHEEIEKTKYLEDHCKAMLQSFTSRLVINKLTDTSTVISE